jgi:AMMECR1 domain-containing protein
MGMRFPLLIFICLLVVPACAGELVASFRADSAQGLAALALARQALAHAVRTHEPLPLPATLPPLLKRRGAAFVSTMDPRTGAPRCCMGTLQPREATLAQEIIANAFAAALFDKRFPPLKTADLARLRVIVSIIGDAQPVADPATLDPVQDGLAVCGPTETGVVLPGETNDPAKMLAWGRIRAGATPDTPVRYLRLEAIRYLDAPPKKEKPA